jgi:hypothetical protein
MSDETIDIKCPLCGNSHTYILDVQRSLYLFGAKGNVKKIRRLFTCPDKNETFESVLEMKEDDRGTITKMTVMGIDKKDKNGQQPYPTPISPHSKALYEAGTSILIDSLETGREFCKSMIGMSTGAIPIYLGILTFMLPEKYNLGFAAGGLIALPAISFLIASLLFVIGYLPVSGEISLDDVDEIDRERTRIIRHRVRFIWSGFGLFMISTLGAIWVIFVNIGVR